MDEIGDADRRILNALQADSRLSNQQLAEIAGMSASACWRRVKALEDAGIIRRYCAIVDPARIGRTFHAIVHVTLTRHDGRNVETFIAEVRRRPEVLDCHATTGEADYHLRVVCADLAAYEAFLREKLTQVAGVSSIESSFSLGQVKYSRVLPI